MCENLQQSQSHDWHQLTTTFKREVKEWLKARESPEKKLAEIEKEMEALNSALPGTVSKEEENELQQRHQRYLLMNEAYWLQRARIDWMASGDNNSRFFHAMAISRKRRNQINAILTKEEEWETSPRGITRLFVAHYKAIYTKQASRKVHEVFPPHILSNLPKIPELVRPAMDLDPTDDEIRKAVMALGPHKAPGPDGFHAKLIQDQWKVFGPAVLAEARYFFSTGIMKPEIAKTNLILIPKKDEAVRVEYFRPVSVCNVVYKTITKILTACLKPFIGDCISPAQSAFVPGRDISENVILLREILHSFKQPNNKNQQFCLKIDLSKAFDRLDWDYLEDILPLYGVPQKLTRWIMSCVRSAVFTVVLNGSGQGFFSPNCGLRQGCSLSPYLFIFGMDLLARVLDSQTRVGNLRGLRIAPGAQPITSCIYADDLLLMGEASVREANTMMEKVHDFATVSGQRVGPKKSFVWFSRVVNEELKSQLIHIFQVPNDTTSDSYLGTPIKIDKAAFDFLIEKVSAKLQVWKSKLLYKLEDWC